MLRFPLRSLAAPALAALFALGCGSDGPQVHEGSLAEGDQTLQTGEYSDVYKVSVEAGQWVLVEMTSDTFSPYVILRSPSENQTENDGADSGNRRAVVRQQVTEKGQWSVLATSSTSGETGAYRLSISVSDVEPALPAGATAAAAPKTGASPAQAPATTATPSPDSGAWSPGEGMGGTPGGTTAGAAEGAPAVGRTFGGTLATGDKTLDSGEFVDSMTIDVQQGQQVIVSMDSDALDPYIILVAPSGTQTDNDDAGQGTGARVTHLASESGAWSVRFTTAKPGETGAYTARVEVR